MKHGWVRVFPDYHRPVDSGCLISVTRGVDQYISPAKY